MRLYDLRVVVELGSEDGDFKNADWALFHLERGLFGRRCTTHLV